MTKIQLDGRKIIILNVNILIFVGLIINYSVIYSDVTYKDWISRFPAILAISFFTQLLSIAILGIRNHILSFITILLCYAFHFSHILLIILNYDFGKTEVNLPFLRVGCMETIMSMGISWLFIYGLYWGMLTELVLHKKRKQRKLLFSNIDPFYSGIFILTITVITSIYVFSYDMKNVAAGAYGTVNESGLFNYVSMFSQLVISGIILVFMSGRLKKKTAAIFLVFVWGFFLGSMLSGKRAFYLMYMGITGFVYAYRYKPRIKLWQIVILFLCGYFLLAVLNAVRDLRRSSITLTLLLDYLKNSSGNVILNMINENAITENVIAIVYKSMKQLGLGKQLFGSFLIVIPGCSYLFPWIDFTQLNVTESLDIFNYGGSFVADAYFDFGYSGIILCFFIGFLLQKFFISCMDAIENKDGFRMALYAPMLAHFLLCIRSTIYKLPRQCVYITIFFVLTMGVYYVFFRRAGKWKVNRKNITRLKQEYHI